jgi:hypothetical protein
LALTTSYIGLPATHILQLYNNKITYTIGGENNSGGVFEDFQGMVVNGGTGDSKFSSR